MTEAEIFGKYLLGKVPNEKSIALYEKAMEELRISPVRNEERLLRFMLKNPGSVKWIDSALAMFRKESQIRKRMLVMCAILETQPEYVELFLPKRTNMIYILWVGACAVFRSFVGVLMIKFI